jgi:hypothetical protein
LGATAVTENLAKYAKHSSANALCYVYTYTFDPAGVGTDATGTWITFVEDADNSEWDLTVDPGDVSSRVGTYHVDIHVCYTTYPESCADVQWVTVTVTSPCATVTNPTDVTATRAYVFEASADNAVAECT